MRQLAIAAAVAVLFSACSSTPMKSGAETPAPVAAKPAPAAAGPVVASETEAQKIARIIQSLAANSIYFDYDDYSIKPQYQTLLKQDYDFLKATPDFTVTLTGNADERGSAEYNLALGQKRAEAVAKALRLLGVGEAQIEAVSYGEEKPRTTCHEEKCWTENRRVDFAFRKAGGGK